MLHAVSWMILRSNQGRTKLLTHVRLYHYRTKTVTSRES